MPRPGIRKHLPHRARKRGLPPGSLVYVGKRAQEVGQPQIQVMTFGPETLHERTVQTAAETLPLPAEPLTTWINVDGLNQTQVLGSFGEAFHLNPLLLEDILNTEQRPKYEQIEDLSYFILKIFHFDKAQEEISTEQVSLVVGPNFLISFMEERGDEFEPIRERLRSGSKRLRGSGPGYLAYSLLDIIVDSYFEVLENIGSRLEEIEDSLTENKPPNILQNVHRLKRELIFLRKHIWPVREVISNLQHGDMEPFNQQVQLHLRDLYDHTIQVMDTLESYRDLLGGIQDLYLSVLSYRMNDVMKVLTVMSTIFIPLTFIVGVYGMNFKYMPELDQPLGYPLTWLAMILIAVGLLFYFRHKRWLE